MKHVYVGEDDETADFSTVRYPQDLGRCATCHAGAQGGTWRATSSITRAACGTCHDATAFTSPAPASVKDKLKIGTGPVGPEGGATTVRTTRRCAESR